MAPLGYADYYTLNANLNSEQIAVIDKNLKYLKNHREYYNDRQVE